MQQTKVASLIETVFGTIAGLVVGVLTQIVIFPWYGIHVPLHDNFSMVVFFAAAGMARTYAVRRLFNAAPWRRFKERRNASN